VINLSIGIACYIKDNPKLQTIYTQRCVDSIRKFVKIPYNLILVDNGSTEEGSKFLRDLNPEYLIRFQHNTGTSHAFNSIVNLSNTEYCYIPNNDHAVCEGSIEGMLNVLKTQDEYKVIGLPDTNWATKEGEYKYGGDFKTLIDHDNFDLDKWNEASKVFANAQKNEIEPTFVGSNYMFSKKTWENFGTFRISTHKGWCAVDNYLEEDLMARDIKFCQYMKGIIYHPPGGQGTSKYVPMQPEQWRLQYLKNMNANIR